MRRPTALLKVIGLVVVAIVISVTGVAATGGPPGTGYYTGQTVQNIGTADATIAVTLYDATDSSKTYSGSFSVPVNGSKTFFASDIAGVPSGFQGSGVVSSDQPVKAIVNVTNKQGTGVGVAGGTAAGQYRGSDTGDTTLYFPLAKGAFGPKTTSFYIQNAGSANATFQATFLMGTSLTDPSPVTYNYTLPSPLVPGQMAVIVPSDAGVPAGRIGSLVVTSAQPMAGAVLEYETTTSPAKILQAAGGFTSNDLDTHMLFPVVKKQLGGRSTGLQIQNVSAGDVSVVVTYHGAGGSCPTGTFTEDAQTLHAKQSVTYLDSAKLPAGCLASAEAVATGGNIAAVVNEAFLPCTGACVQRSTTYAAFAAKNATTKLVAPVFKEDFGNKRSGLSVQNVSGTDATATVAFKVGTTTYTYNNLSIKAGASVTLLDMTNTAAFPAANWAGGNALPNASLAAVTITADQNIIGIVNEAPLPGTAQDNINYEAFNVTVP